MKLRQIIENAYDGLEDADEFEDPDDVDAANHYCTECNSYAHYCEICNQHWCDCTGDRPTLSIDVENADINQCSACGQWFCHECGGKFNHPLLDYTTNLCRPCAANSNSTPVEDE